MLEDIKDMLTEKAIQLNEILLTRLSKEKEIGVFNDATVIAHVVDIFQEEGEQ